MKMKNNINSLFILLIILYINIIVANPFHRNLAETKTELTFVKAYDLFFLESTWQFKITYSYTNTPPSTGSQLFTPILYKGSPSHAKCQVMSIDRLDCSLEQTDQLMSDLIQINNSGDSVANINWKSGLEGNYDIPINTTLNYLYSFDLKYTTTSYNWDFKIKIGQDDILPENGVVLIDLSFTDSKQGSAKCIHNDHYLTCNFIWKRDTYYLIKIAPKKDGSITWNNFGSIEEILTIKLLNLEHVYYYRCFHFVF